MEAGTHSPWVSRFLQELGLRAVVANPRKTRAIYENESKSCKSSRAGASPYEGRSSHRAAQTTKDKAVLSEGGHTPSQLGRLLHELREDKTSYFVKRPPGGSSLIHTPFTVRDSECGNGQAHKSSRGTTVRN
jgi:hypothetical protein